jgi:hypothetical protein
VERCGRLVIVVMAMFPWMTTPVFVRIAGVTLYNLRRGNEHRRLRDHHWGGINDYGSRSHHNGRSHNYGQWQAHSDGDVHAACLGQAWERQTSQGDKGHHPNIP